MQLTLNQDEVTKAVVDALSEKYPGLVTEDSTVEFTVDEDTIVASIDISGGDVQAPAKKTTRKRRSPSKKEEPVKEEVKEEEATQEEPPFAVDEPAEEPEPENNEGEPEPSTPLFGG